MYIVGIDVGFSLTEKTGALYVLGIDPEDRAIQLVQRPFRFVPAEAPHVLKGMALQNEGVHCISVDAALTPVRLLQRAKSGRSVDKRFSRGGVRNASRGPQPGSIATPRQGWPLYEAGMDLVENLQAAGLGRYVHFAHFERAPVEGVIESIPKLSQALLVPPKVVRERDKKTKIDDHIFPLLFADNGSEREALDRALGGFVFSDEVEAEIENMALKSRRYHEELGAFVAVFQGVLATLGRGSVVGQAGDNEGYYVLPPRDAWHPEWLQTFDTTRADSVKVIDLYPAQTDR